jgi:hypothetical protein
MMRRCDYHTSEITVAAERSAREKLSVRTPDHIWPRDYRWSSGSVPSEQYVNQRTATEVHSVTAGVTAHSDSRHFYVPV